MKSMKFVVVVYVAVVWFAVQTLHWIEENLPRPMQDILEKSSSNHYKCRENSQNNTKTNIRDNNNNKW